MRARCLQRPNKGEVPFVSSKRGSRFRYHLKAALIVFRVTNLCCLSKQKRPCQDYSPTDENAGSLTPFGMTNFKVMAEI